MELPYITEEKVKQILLDHQQKKILMEISSITSQGCHSWFEPPIPSRIMSPLGFHIHLALKEKNKHHRDVAVEWLGKEYEKNHQERHSLKITKQI